MPPTITLLDVVYYFIYGICLYLSFNASKQNLPGIDFLRLMLVIGLVTEVNVEGLQYLKREENGPYYIYIPLEYLCLVLFYTQQTENKIFKTILHSSVPLYFLMALPLGILYYRLQGYPSLVYNISCLLNSVWISLLLFNFSGSDGQQLWKNPSFIALSALLIFFAGIFFFNLAYPYLNKTNPIHARNFRNYTNISLNYLLYSLLSYAFLCSMRRSP